MKVKFLDGCVADKKAHYAGDVAEISDKDARFLLKTGRVVKVEDSAEIQEPVVQEQEEVVVEEEQAVEEVISQGLETETREAEMSKNIKKKAK